jgi:hypothetical protein
MHYYKFVKVAYENIAYNNTIFISENLSINIKLYLLAYALLHKLKNKIIQTTLYVC